MARQLWWFSSRAEKVGDYVLIPTAHRKRKQKIESKTCNLEDAEKIFAWTILIDAYSYVLADFEVGERASNVSLEPVFESDSEKFINWRMG